MLIDSVTSENGEGVVALWSESVVASWIANDKSKCLWNVIGRWRSQSAKLGSFGLALPQYLGALAEYSCDHQFRCGCRGPWRNLFEGDELSSTQKLT